MFQILDQNGRHRVKEIGHETRIDVHDGLTAHSEADVWQLVLAQFALDYIATNRGTRYDLSGIENPEVTSIADWMDSNDFPRVCFWADVDPEVFRKTLENSFYWVPLRKIASRILNKI